MIDYALIDANYIVHDVSLYLLSTEFPTNRTEMNAVFDIFDRSNTNTIDYREFVDALKSDRLVSICLHKCMDMFLYMTKSFNIIKGAIGPPDNHV